MITIIKRQYKLNENHLQLIYRLTICKFYVITLPRTENIIKNIVSLGWAMKKRKRCDFSVIEPYLKSILCDGLTKYRPVFLLYIVMTLKCALNPNKVLD